MKKINVKVTIPICGWN